MSFNTIIDWNTCSDAQQRELLMRPAISASESITRTVAEILDNVKAPRTTRCASTARSLTRRKSALYRLPSRKSLMPAIVWVMTSNRRWPSR